MKLSYYPGCSLHGTAVEYDVSTRQVCQALGVELVELDDWNCCGASAAHMLNRDLAVAASARNLAIAARRGMELVVPCAACYHSLRKADYQLRKDADLADSIRTATGMDYPGGVKVHHLLHIMAEPAMLDKIRSKTTKPLKGLRFGCYYGCLIYRPANVMGHQENPENPQTMETILGALGAETVDWSYKTDCCGASFSLARTDIAAELMAKIVRNALDCGIEALVAACPLCMANLDTRQPEISALLGQPVNIPIFYFTELMGLAMGLEAVRKVLSKHITSVRPALDKLS